MIRRSTYVLCREVPITPMTDYISKRVPCLYSGTHNDLWIAVNDSKNRQLYNQLALEVEHTMTAMFNDEIDDEDLRKLTTCVRNIDESLDQDPDKSLSMAKRIFPTYAVVETKEGYRRAKIIKWTDFRNCEVFYIDEGFSEVVSVLTMFPLTQNLGKYPWFAIKCYLVDDEGCSPVWTEEKIEAIMDLLNSTFDATALILPPTENGFPIILKNSVLSQNILSYIVTEKNSPVPQFPIVTDGLTALQRQYASDDSESEDENMSGWNPTDLHFYSISNHYGVDMDDPAVAIHGYASQDDAVICHLFGKTGKCFKGDSCRKQHILIDPEKYSNVPQLIFSKTVRVLCRLEEGERYQLKGICAIPGALLVFLQSDYEKYAKEFSVMEERMNDPSIMGNYQRLTIPPGIGEIVLVKFTGKWQRGQCLASDPDEDKYTVRVADQGMLIEVGHFDLRSIPKGFIEIPFMAREVRLKNLEISKEKNIDAEFSKWLVKYPNELDIICVGNGEYDFVELFVRGINLGADLIDAGLVTKTVSIIPSSGSKFVPG